MSFTQEQEDQMKLLLAHPIVGVLTSLDSDGVQSLTIAMTDAVVLHPIAETVIAEAEKAPLNAALDVAEQELADFDEQGEQAQQLAITQVNLSRADERNALLETIQIARQALEV